MDCPLQRINDGLYRAEEAGFVSRYLILGKEKALLFDPGYGFDALPQSIARVTQLPLTVVASHGHPDHVLGSWRYVDEMVMKFITGREPIENWDTYVSKVKGIGIDNVIVIYQEALDSWNF